ncbi:MAG: protein kinase [Pirellulales bacterium]|nr:protein kinase [Pirellulales bacterium]
MNIPAPARQLSPVTPAELLLDDYVQVFENANPDAAGRDLREFAPAASHPQYLDILCELARVDLEQRADRGESLLLDEYRQRYPELFQVSAISSRLEYEYRRLVGACAAEQLGDSLDPWRFSPSLLRELSLPAPAGASRGDSAQSTAVEDCGFTILGELGSGTFGKVYLARQAILAQRLVVLKITSAELSEPQILARLQHANIVPIYSVHVGRGQTTLCMPYYGATTFAQVLRGLPGGDRPPHSSQALLSTLCNQQSTLCNQQSTLGKEPSLSTSAGASQVPDILDRLTHPEAEELLVGPHPALQRLQNSDYATAVLWLFARLADGLQHAHSRGILHLDIKPANILLADDGTPLLLDFNLARDQRRESTTEVEKVGGTLGYMSPEQLRHFNTGNEKLDERSDIYSLGLVLYEFLRGERRVTANAQTIGKEQIAAQLDERRRVPAALAGKSPGLTPAVDAIVAKCLAFDPAARYQTAAELRTDLDRQLENFPLRYAREKSWLERLSKWRRRQPRLATGLATAALAACILIPLATLSWSRGNALLTSRHDLLVADIRDTQANFYTAKDRSELLLSLSGGDLDLTTPGIFQAQTALQTLEEAAFHPERQTALAAALTPAEQKKLRHAAGELSLSLSRVFLQQSQSSADQNVRQVAWNQARMWQEHAAKQFSPERPLGLRWQAENLSSPVNTEMLLARVENASREKTASAADLLVASQELCRRGAYGQAIPLLERAALLEARNYAIWLTLGQAYYHQEKFPSAAAAFAVCMALREDVAWAYFGRGLCHLRSRDFAAAEADFSAASQRERNFWAADINRALALLELNQPLPAKQLLDDVLAVGQHQTRALLWRSKAHTLLGDAAAAQRDKAAALASTPTDETGWVALGYEQLDSAPGQAITCFDKALQLNPHSREALQNKAHALSEQLGQVEEAVAVLDQLLKLDPAYLPALGGRGVLLARLGKREQAHADAQACLKLDRNPQTLYQLAGIYALTSRQDKGDKAQAYNLATLAFQAEPRLLDWVATDRDLDPLRSDAEFLELLNRFSQLPGEMSHSAAGETTVTPPVSQ